MSVTSFDGEWVIRAAAELSKKSFVAIVASSNGGAINRDLGRVRIDNKMVRRGFFRPRIEEVASPESLRAANKLKAECERILGDNWVVRTELINEQRHDFADPNYKMHFTATVPAEISSTLYQEFLASAALFRDKLIENGEILKKITDAISAYRDELLGAYNRTEHAILFPYTGYPWDKELIIDAQGIHFGRPTYYDGCIDKEGPCLPFAKLLLKGLTKEYMVMGLAQALQATLKYQGKCTISSTCGLKGFCPYAVVIEFLKPAPEPAPEPELSDWV